MGFDPLKLRLYRELLENEDFDLGLRRVKDIQVRSPEAAWRGCPTNLTSRFLNFRPHPGWTGAIEPDSTLQPVNHHEHCV